MKNNHLLGIAAILCTLLVLPPVALAQDQHYYFYNPKNDFGSDAIYSPLSAMINGSFDILRNGAHSKNVFIQPYNTGMTNVWQNISSPLYNISNYGWGRFSDEELFNLKFNSQEAQFMPNFSDHTVGEGMLYAKTAEWYDYHGYRYPYLWSFVTTSAYQFMNETVENGGYRGSSVDCISDMLIYNTAGFILFSINDVKEFFSSTLSLADWSMQPILDPTSGYLFNAGEQFVIRHSIPYAPRYTGFVYWGIHAIAGVGYTYDNGGTLSVGVGQVANRINENRYKGLRFLTPSLDGAVGVFYDKNSSLMTSVLLSGPRLPNAEINVYPGFVDLGWMQPGFVLALGKWDKFFCGVTFAHVPLGLALGSRYDATKAN